MRNHRGICIVAKRRWVACGLLWLATGLFFSVANVARGEDLPKLFLIGDSIRSGYQDTVQGLLGTQFEISVQPAGWTGDAVDALNFVDDWLAAGPYDVIHFNWGLHDVYTARPGMDGEVAVSIEDYQTATEAMVAKLKASGATLVWANTTPSYDCEPTFNESDIVAYNAVAKAIMDANDIPINDLHSLAWEYLPEIQLAPGNIHYNAEGNRILGTAVAGAICDAYGIPFDPYTGGIPIHRGATNPLTEGWVPNVSGVGSAGAVVDDLGTGVDAWRTTDTGSEAGTAYYKGEGGLSEQDLTDIAAKGWSMRATLRVDDTTASGFDQTAALAPGIQVAFEDPGIWALLSLGSGGLGNTVMSFKGGYPFGSTITYNIAGSGYNDYEMIWDPVDGLDILVNGQVVVDNYDCSTSESMAASLGDRIYWGAMDTPGEGSGYWSSVDFEITRVPGDANGDGVVDGSDVTILAANWQRGTGEVDDATWAMGDFNGDRKVDGSDVTILAGNWQYGIDTAAASVPEPSCLALFLSIAILLAAEPARRLRL